MHLWALTWANTIPGPGEATDTDCRRQELMHFEIVIYCKILRFESSTKVTCFKVGFQEPVSSWYGITLVLRVLRRGLQFSSSCCAIDAVRRSEHIALMLLLQSLQVCFRQPLEEDTTPEPSAPFHWHIPEHTKKHWGFFRRTSNIFNTYLWLARDQMSTAVCSLGDKQHIAEAKCQKKAHGDCDVQG